MAERPLVPTPLGDVKKNIPVSKDSGILEAAERMCQGKVMTFIEVKTKVQDPTNYITE